MEISPSNLVSVDWLQQHLEQPNLVVLFTQLQDPVNQHKQSHFSGYIPYSRHFDFENEFCDANATLPHTMPSADVFTRQAQLLGINSNSVIVVYDNIGIYSAPRVWWMLKSMGHDNVKILDGGLPNWIKSKKPVVKTLCHSPVLGDFTAHYRPHYFISADQIVAQNGSINLLDARSTQRFAGLVSEPRQGLRSGHAPGAINLPFNQCLTNGQLLPSSELKLLLQALPIKQGVPCVLSCGSGVTACILALALSECGYADITVYDGSWSEWGARQDLPVECA